MEEQKPIGQQKEEKLSNKEFFNLSALWHYFFRKKGEHVKGDFNLRAMHFINKFSIVVFLLGILYMIIKNII